MSLKTSYHQHDEDLLNAARDGCRETVQRCLKLGANINCRNEDGETSLHLATWNWKTKTVKLLIAAGIDLNVQEKNGKTALHLAAGNRKTETIQLLIAAGIDLNLQDKDGMTALHIVAGQGYTEIVHVLIDNYIDINVQNKSGDTALHFAAMNGKTEIVKLLIGAGMDRNIHKQNGKTVLHYAAYYNSKDVVEILMRYECDKNLHDIDGNTALHIAANNNCDQVVAYFLNIDCDPNITNTKNGKTALHYAANYNSKKLIQILIEKGCEKNLQDMDGNTALHIAAMNNHKHAVGYLLNSDCDPSTLNNNEKKPIEMAKDEIIIMLFKDNETTLLPGLPIEVRKFDKNSANVFSSLLKGESYPHYESRVMLVGEPGTGKTTIARYLAGKRPSKFRMSTDGIELHNGCAYMDRETKIWLGGEQDFSIEDITLSRSLMQENKIKKYVSLPDPSPVSHDVLHIKEEVTLSSIEFNLKDELNDSAFLDVTPKTKWSDQCCLLSTESFMKVFESGNVMSECQFETVPVYSLVRSKQITKRLSECVSEKKTDDGRYETVIKDKILLSQSQEKYSDKKSSDNFSDWNKLVVQDDSYRTEYTDSTNDRHISEAQFDKFKTVEDSDDVCPKNLQTVTKPGVIRKLKKFFGVTKKVKEVKVSFTKEKFLQKSSKVGKKQLHNRNIAPIFIWDFGGQDVFYSTHQTFLTYRAVYMIVLNGSRKLDDPCPFEQYLPGRSGKKTAKDYLLFWINTIVTYCKGSNQGFPKIVIVLTHKDQVQESEVEHRRHELFTEINQMFENTSLKQHLVIDEKIFVNANDKHDPEMAKIKGVIISESENQPTWGESLPKCFIPLELECALLISRNVSLITIDHLRKINSLQPIRQLSETELKVFLRFQHSIGKVLYFDEEKLDNHIILSPSLLINAFKSIVTDRSFCQRDKDRKQLWDVMGKKGMISKKDIHTVWKKTKYRSFYIAKDYLLDVMTHLDIIVEPRRYDKDRNRIPADFYYVASMVRAKDDTGYLKSTGFTQRSITIAYQSSSLIIPPALSFRFISYCLYVWAVKTYGETNKDMLFHRSGVFTIDPSLDMHISCEDDMIIVRLVHARKNALIMRDMASSINECLTSALEKISQLYIRTNSDQSNTRETSFITRICCNSPDKPCILEVNKLPNLGKKWICPLHGIEHNIHTIMSWFPGQDEDICEPECPVTNDEFLKERPTDLHIRRLSLLYSRNEIRELAVHLGLKSVDIDNIMHNADPEIWKFEVVRKCRDKFALTFQHIRDAFKAGEQENIHRLCKLVKGDPIDFDTEPEKWDVALTEKHIDRLAPLIGNNSLQFLIELEMEFKTWEQISYRHRIERDLVKLNKDILEEWRTKFCKMHSLKPTLRNIAQAFSNIGKHIKFVETTLSDMF